MVECLYHQTVKGVKTQTRRSGGLEAVNGTVKNFYGPQLPPNAWHPIEGKAYSTDCPQGYTHMVWFSLKGKIDNSIVYPEIAVVCKPRYKVGEVLYLKEPTLVKTTFPGVNDAIQENVHQTVYKFDHEYDYGRLKWSNKLFMPASAARAYVRITGIRCERLLDISDEDCIAEGIDHRTFVTPEANLTYYLDYQKQQYNCSAKNSFLSLFKFANKVKEVPNIFVWVYKFEYLKDYQHEQPKLFMH